MMKLAVPFCCLTLGAAVIAQTPFTTPPGYLSTEADAWQGVFPFSYCSEFGNRPDWHVQQVDGEIKALGFTVLTSVGLRPDYRNYGSEALGRSWKNVTLSLSDGDLKTMGRNFAQNQLSTPTTVFSSSVTWPTLRGYPSPAKPAPWLAAFKFPFKTSYIYSRKTDLCLDWTFQGGTGAGSLTWTTPTPYYLDGILTRTLAAFAGVHRSTGPVCTDSSIVPKFGSANVYAWTTLFGTTFVHNPPNMAGKAMLRVTGQGTAPASLVAQFITLKGAHPGVNIGARCNNLMVDLSAPGILVFETTHPNSWNYGSRNGQTIVLGSLAALAPLGKTSVWSQGFWLDSRTRQPSLTTAYESTVDFAVKLNTTEPKKSVIAAPRSAPLSPNKPYYWPNYLPLTRFN